MKLHSDILTEGTIKDALTRAKVAGHVDKSVVFSELAARGSRTRKNGFEIRLEWLGEKQKGDGRRYTNSGNGGASTKAYGAFWEEWGWFIDELYSVDPDLVFGPYKTREVFDEMTRYAFG
jgi:hypothetical protein